MNRVDTEMEAFWRQYQQELQRQPQLAHDRKYMKAQADLLGSLIEKFERLPNLTDFEMATLVSTRASQKDFVKRADRQLLKRGSRVAGKFSAQLMKGAGYVLDDQVSKTMGRIADRSPFLLMLPLHLLRIFPSGVGIALKGLGAIAEWLTDKALPKRSSGLQANEAPRHPVNHQSKDQQRMGKHFVDPDNTRQQPDRGKSSGQSANLHDAAPPFSVPRQYPENEGLRPDETFLRLPNIPGAPPTSDDDQQTREGRNIPRGQASDPRQDPAHATQYSPRFQPDISAGSKGLRLH